MHHGHNIGLQRTAPCGLAAEAGALGGWIIVVLALVSISISTRAEAQDSCGPGCVAVVSISHGMASLANGPSILLWGDGSGDLVTSTCVDRDMIPPCREERYMVAKGDPSLESLFLKVVSLDPLLESNLIPDGGGVTVRCNPPGSLLVMRSTWPEDKTPIPGIRDLLLHIQKTARLREQWGFVAEDAQ